MPELSTASRQRLAAAHPLLRELFTAVAGKAAIEVLESQRGRSAAEWREAPPPSGSHDRSGGGGRVASGNRR